ncbi:MAG: DUF1361 domain-containing protein [Chitinophagaceae bacterium]
MTKFLSFPRYLLQQYSLRTEMERLMVASVFFGSLMLAIRIFYTGRLTFVSLEWNLFLAFIPYFITQWVNGRISLIKNKWKFASIFFVWMLFIPNSFYILTDLFHLQENNNAPLWFDLLLILSFAWNGLLAGILSVRHMEKIILVLWRSRHELLFLYPIMLLNALGIYIGRYLRYNSWDIVTNPFHLVMDIFDMLWHPIVYKNAWGMIFFYSVFILILYLTIKRISKFIS